MSTIISDGIRSGKKVFHEALQSSKIDLFFVIDNNSSGHLELIKDQESFSFQ